MDTFDLSRADNLDALFDAAGLDGFGLRGGRVAYSARTVESFRDIESVETKQR